jgi:hypothetical protein
MNRPDGIYLVRNTTGPSTLVEIADGMTYEVSVVRGKRMRVKQLDDLCEIATKPEPSTIVLSDSLGTTT